MAASFHIPILLLLLLVVVVTMMVTQSHFSASVCWKTFTCPTLSMELPSVGGRKVTLFPKVKGHVLGICVLYDMFVIVLLFAPL